MNWPIASIIIVGLIVGGICFSSYIHRNDPHIPSQEEIFKSECIAKGGNPTTKSGWSDRIYISEYKCEGVQL